MSNTAPATEVLRRIHIDKHFLEVGEWPDCPDYLELRTAGDDNVKYWGALNMSLSPAAAKLLGQALIDAANEKGATK